MQHNKQYDELQRRDNILKAVNHAAEMFLVQPDWLPFIEDILAQLGKATEADRVFIYKMELDQPKLENAKIFSEWAREGVVPQSELASDSLYLGRDDDRLSWVKSLNRGKLFHAKVSELSKKEQECFNNTGVVSFLVIPVIIDKKIWGFMGFNQCRESRSWAAVEIEALNTAANIFSAAVARRKSQQQLLHMATHDFLTNLPNRLLFEDRFILAKARAERSQEKLALISIDLNKFKFINDTWGHPIGDQVLVEIASRFEKAVRTADTVARIGGDEFSVIVEGIHDSSGLKMVMQKLEESLANPIHIEKEEITISASMGAAIFPDAGLTLQSLMNAADKALYQVKTSNLKYRIFQEDQLTFLKK